MGVYSRRLAKGMRWFYSGQHKSRKYFSRAIYLTKADARLAEAKRLEELEREVKGSVAKMTLLELCTLRLDYISAAKSKDYYRANKQAFSKLLKYIGDIELSKITRAMIHEHFLKESLRLQGEKKGNHQLNGDLRMINALFNYAVNELEVIDRNPAKKVKPYPIEKRLKHIPSDDDIRKILALATPSQERIIMFAMETACRISEALRATGEDIDLNMELLTLWTRKKKNSDLTPRRIPLPDCVRDYKREGRLFPEYTYRPAFIADLCHRAGIKLFGWHAFRHRKASLMAQRNIPLIEIMNYLGHEHIEVTQRYLRLLGYTKY